MARWKSVWFVLVLCVGMLRGVGAQSSRYGMVSGTVADADGRAVAGAAVTLSAADAPEKTVVSAADGAYALGEVPSGTYVLRAKAAGFAAWEQMGVSVAVGRTTHVPVQLQVAGAQETVTVTAGPSTMDVTQTSSVVNVDRDRVEELPIRSRNYLSFVLLSPQVAAANPALAQGSGVQSGGSFSFGGLRPGSNAVYLDGVNDDDEFTGGSRTQLSPEAISDFQIVNHGFAAESGGGAGGSIDVQTREGLNRVHGDAFVFMQNGALNATPPLELTPYKPDENRVRAGVALGGALQRDRMFYYVAVEQEHARGEDANDLKPVSLSALNAAIRGYAPMSNVMLQGGFFPTADEETESSGRVDRVLTKREAVMLRYAFTNSRNVNDAFHTDEFAERTARGSSFVQDHSVNGTLTSTIGEELLNKLSFEVARRRAVERTGSTVAPGVMVAGAALFGTPFEGNSKRFETHVEFADALTMQRGGHTLTFGGRVDRVSEQATVMDGAQGFFVFENVAAVQNAQPDFFAKTFGNFDTEFAEVRTTGFAQDHWVRGTLTLDYGLRYEFNRLPSSGLSQDALHVSPRVGLAWTPRKAMVVRSGFGTFYDRYQLGTVSRLLQLDGVHGFEQIVEDSAAADVWRSGSVPTTPLAGVAPSVWRAQGGLRNPYSEVGSLSVEQGLPLQTTLTGEYQYVHGVRLGKTANVNLAAPFVLTAGNTAMAGISSPTAQQLGRLVFPAARVDARFDAVNEFASEASSTYHGATVTLNRQFQDDLQVLAGYTFSKTVDDASYDSEQAQNPYFLRGERGLSLMDQRHRFTLSALWLIGPDLGDPADAVKNVHPGRLLKAIYGLEFAPVVRISSGFRANPLTGLDSSRAHVYPFVSRPEGMGRNSLATSANVDADLRVLKMIALGRGHLDVVAESFNVLNHRNVALVNPVFGSAASAQAGFGKPMATFGARKVQFSLDFEF